MVGDLTHYLYTNNMLRYIEGYVQKVNPGKAPQVVGALLDAEASDEFVNNLILSVRSLIPVEQLCAEVEQRNRSVLPATRSVVVVAAASRATLRFTLQLLLLLVLFFSMVCLSQAALAMVSVVTVGRYS